MSAVQFAALAGYVLAGTAATSALLWLVIRRAPSIDTNQGARWWMLFSARARVATYLLAAAALVGAAAAQQLHPVALVGALLLVGAATWLHRATRNAP